MPPFTMAAIRYVIAGLILVPIGWFSGTPEQRITDRPGLRQWGAMLLLGAMTPAEKFQQLVGAPGIVAEIPSCYGARHVPGVPRLGIPTFRITNGPVGVGQNDCVPVNTPNLPRAAMMSTASAKATALP